jgi:carbamoyl-phosphate synthase small subunit
VAEHTVAIANIDTRKLTRLLRTRGAQNGAIVGLAAGELVTQALIDQAIAAAQGAPSMAGQDLAKVVSVAQPYEWTQTEWRLAQPDGQPGYGTQTAPTFHVVAYDFGVKKTSCACWRSVAARSPWCRHRRRQRRC